MSVSDFETKFKATGGPLDRLLARGGQDVTVRDVSAQTDYTVTAIKIEQVGFDDPYGDLLVTMRESDVTWLDNNDEITVDGRQWVVIKIRTHVGGVEARVRAPELIT